jgi:mono/diheme cytochrome c family protein
LSGLAEVPVVNKAEGAKVSPMIAIIEKGKDKMPGFEGKLSKDQITAIVEYIRSEKKK